MAGFLSRVEEHCSRWCALEHCCVHAPGSSRMCARDSETQTPAEQWRDCAVSAEASIETVLTPPLNARFVRGRQRRQTVGPTPAAMSGVNERGSPGPSSPRWRSRAVSAERQAALKLIYSTAVPPRSHTLMKRGLLQLNAS